MRERSQTTPRRRRSGPKQPLPTVVSTAYNTEDIYGTKLLASQRRFMDPWDLENYDYVRKKLDIEVTSSTVLPDYETAMDYEHESHSPSPTAADSMALASTMPRPHTRRLSRSQCQLECCRLPSRSRNQVGRHKEPLYAARSELYGIAPSRYDDYMATMTRQLHLDEDEEQEELYAEQRQIYNGYGGFSSASSNEQHSSIGDEMPTMTTLPRRAATLQRRPQPNQNREQTRNQYGSGYGTAPQPRRKRSAAAATTNKSKNVMQVSAPPSSAPQIDFPAPPPLSPAYDYCNPYATMPYCSLPDCAECQQQATSLIYAAPSTLYGTLASGVRAAAIQCDSPSDSSLYAGIYARKFGLSKKGLLQIDYSCSWNDLDRVMGRQY